MNVNLKRGLFFICLLLIPAFAGSVFAQELTIKDLGVETTGILPSNPFYFFKEWGRSIRQTFSWSDIRRAELQLEIVNEQAAEIKKLEEINIGNIEGLLRALNNYNIALELLKTRLMALKNNPEAPRLLDSLLDKVLKHREILLGLYEKLRGLPAGDELYDLVVSSETALGEIVAFVPGNIEDSQKFRDRFLLIASKQRSDLREFGAAEFVDALEELVDSSVKDEIMKLKDDLLLRWIGKLQAAKGGFNFTTSALSGSVENPLRRLRVLDEAREKVSDSEARNQINVVRQKVLEKTREENSVTESEAEDLIEKVNKLINDASSRLPKSGEVRASASELLGRARFNLESAQSFFEDEIYGSAYGAAVSASAAAKAALSVLIVKPGDYRSELSSIKEYFDSLSLRARISGLLAEENRELFSLLGSAENQIAKIAGLIARGSASPSIVSSFKDLKLTLSSVDQMMQDIMSPEIVAAAVGEAARGSEINVEITDNQFVPSVVKIKKGDTVVWINKNGSNHWIVSDALKTLNSGEIIPEGSFSFRFDSIGVFKYKDKSNPSSLGVVDVE